MTLTLDKLNNASMSQFSDLLAGVYGQAAWIAESAAGHCLALLGNRHRLSSLR